MDIKQTNRNPRWFHPDVPGSVQDHLLGEEHSGRHKFIFGTFISAIGLLIVNGGHATGIAIIEAITHHVGYGIHGIGWLPVVSILEKKARRMARGGGDEA